jgi:hypothetical protein
MAKAAQAKPHPKPSAKAGAKPAKKAGKGKKGC